VTEPISNSAGYVQSPLELRRTDGRSPCISDVTDYRLLSRLHHFWRTPLSPHLHCENVKAGRWFIWNVGTRLPNTRHHSKVANKFVATTSHTVRLSCMTCQRPYQCSNTHPECQTEAAIYQSSRCSVVLAKCHSPTSIRRAASASRTLPEKHSF
jgi:hypothetical protein